MSNWKFVVNIATPETPAELKLVTDFVSTHEMGISGAYVGVVSAMTESSHWHRPGFDFKFWFNDEQTARAFMEAVEPFTNSTIASPI